MLSNQDRKMTDQVIDWKTEIGFIAGPFLPSDTKQSWLSRASRRCSVSLRHLQSLYYGHVKDPKFSVASNILTAAEKARIEEAQRDAEVVAKFFSRHAQALASADADRNRSEIDAFLAAARVLGRGNSA